MSGTLDPGQQLLGLIANPFASTLASNSVFAALTYAFGISTFLFSLFSILRPRRPSVYAPRSKHADTQHAPPPLKKGLFGWRAAIRNVKEEELLDKIGLDAIVFLRFLRMSRNIFLVLSLFGCGILIPTNLAPGTNIYQAYGNVAILMRFTPQYIFGTRFWAYVVCAYVFNLTIYVFLYHNYRVIARLRHKYLHSDDYLGSLHSRTLMITHIAKNLRNDEGLNAIISKAKAGDMNPSVSVGRDITDLADLLEHYDKAVVKLEKVLAVYLSNPNKLPSKRPTMKPFKYDKQHPKREKVDAINYLYSYIKSLKSKISQVREEISIGKQNAMPYGFASFSEVETAHTVASVAGDKKVLGANIALAPRPNDIMWKSLAMTRAQERNRRFWCIILVVAITILFNIPNILVAVFLSNLSHLGRFWPLFQGSLDRHPIAWAVVQGILPPLIQNFFYFFLPSLIRKIYNSSGDNSKTQRERHVANKLFTFYVINRLFVFSVFSSLFAFISAVTAASSKIGTWTALKQANIFKSLMLGLCNVSPYWLTLQMQTNLAATADLLQLTSLIVRPLTRTFQSPSPREIIMYDAPAPMMYAEYYSSYLFIIMIGMCFGTLQPLLFPITAVFLTLEHWFKKYLLQYVYVTKHESGGMFWKNLFNRILFAAFSGTIIIALIVGSSSDDYRMLYAMIPLPIILVGFKWYCARTFDKTLKYSLETDIDAETRPGHMFLNVNRSKPVSAKSSESAKSKLSVRFGHPDLYKKLMTIMVNDKAKNFLDGVIQGHTNASLDGNDDDTGVFGYSDVYMARMAGPAQPGKLAQAQTSDGFELVAETDMEFSKFKKREDFREEAGGNGELYGKAEDLITRSGTPASELGYPERPGTPSSFTSRTQSQSPSRGTMYPAGYHHASFRDASPASRLDVNTPPRINVTMASEDYDLGDPSEEARGRLLQYGAPMGERDRSLGIAPTPGTGLATPASLDDEEETSYDYFRRGRGNCGNVVFMS